MQSRTGSRVQPLKKCGWSRGCQSLAEPPADLAPRDLCRPPADGDKRLQGAPAPPSQRATLGALWPPPRETVPDRRETHASHALCRQPVPVPRGSLESPLPGVVLPGRDLEADLGRRGGCLCHSLYWKGALVAADTPPARTAGSAED